ncbi:MAG: hypothetical protein ABDI07_10255 [Candidatus Kryptonium sp.]
MVLVYETQNFKRSIPRGFEKEIREFIESVRSSELYRITKILDRHGPYLKKRMGKFRIITRLEYVNDLPVLILLDIMARGDNRYENFNQDYEQFGINYLDPIIQQEIEDIKNFVERNKPAEPYKQPLPNYFYQWLTLSPLIHPKDEILIYETYEWCEKIKYSNYLPRFYDIIYALIDQTQKLEVETINDMFRIAYKPERKDYKILYTEFSVNDTPRAILLVQPLVEPEQPSDDIVSSYTNFIQDIFKQRGTNQLVGDDIAKISHRAYPWYTLASESIWIDIESDSQANLALSSEEENILKDLTSPENPSLPAFINGRAGSGKSTMLYYLFSNFIYKKLREKIEGDPIFITYSDKLLETAKKSVENILNSHAELAREEKISSEHLYPYFKTFQNLIFDVLPEEIKLRFSPNKKLTFHRFRSEIWKRIYNRPSYLSPELAWFVIRAYIKGYKEFDFMTPEEYEELPKKEKSVPDQVFRDIYQNIWNYYQRISTENGYWDDQDLVREALSVESSLPEFVAIFCDEAQDFTRVELRFIMRLSIFSKYTLPFGVRLIPILFAGDPMQTINPTGFRWETTGAIFHEEVIQQIDPAKKLNLKLHFKELKYNYRSTPSITEFSNVILMWRSAMSNIKLEPQKPWKTYYKGTKPYRFVVQNDIKDKLKDILKDKIVIIPAEEEQLSNFIQNDELLSEIYTVMDESWPPKNILTPMIAKGLEFDDVIVYKFGEHFKNLIEQKNLPRSLTEIFRKVSEKQHNVLFDIDYFFNQLYVSISRAKKNLFIIDTADGNESLWRYTHDKNSIIDSLPENFDKKEWENYITPSQIGEAQLISLTPQEKRKIAEELKQRGIFSKEPSYLKRAAQYFEEINDTIQKDECIAYSLKFEGKFKEASILFRQLKNFDLLKECLVLGNLWDDLFNFYQENPSLKSEPTYKLVEFIVSSDSDSFAFAEFTRFLFNHLTYLKDKIYLHSIKQKLEWQTAIKKYISYILSIPNPDLIDQEVWLSSTNVLDEIAHLFGSNAKRALAFAYFNICDYDSACEIWQEIRETEHKHYYISKSKVSQPPDNLKFLLKLNEYDEIIKLWENAGKPFDYKWIEAVRESLVKLGRDNELTLINILIDIKSNKEDFKNKYEKFISKSKSLGDINAIFSLTKEVLEAIHPIRGTLNLSLDETEKVRISLELIEIMFEELQNYKKEKAEIFVNTFSYLAYSDTTYENDQDTNQSFEEALEELDYKLLPEFLSIEELASILEKTSSYKKTLEFYYKYLKNRANIGKEIHEIIEKDDTVGITKIMQVISNPDVLFVAKRMLKVKLKQANYHREKGEIHPFERLIYEAKELAKLFNLSIEEIEDSEPEYPEVFPIKFERFKAKPPEVKSSSEFEKYFTYYPFEVRINRKTKLILITNLETYDTKKISFVEFTGIDSYIYASYQIKIQKYSQSEIALEFASKITGEQALEGIAIIRFQ